MRTAWTVLASTLALAACGGGSSSNPDSRVTDANKNADTSNPDARVQNSNATIAVTQVAVATPGATSFGGAGITITFEDPSRGGKAPDYGTGDPGTCTVWRWTVGSGPQPAPLTDEGQVKILNENAGSEAILKPVGQCTFQQDGKYHCVTDGGASQGGTATSTGVSGATTYKLTGKTFAKADVVGQYMQITGIGTSSTTATINYDGAFPIIDLIGTDTLVVINKSATAGDTKDFTAATFALLQGEGPIPQGGVGQQHEDKFLVDTYTDTMHTAEVKLDPGASTRWPDGFDVQHLEPIGAGFTLTDFNPTAFPSTDTADLPVTCAGTCGTQPQGTVAHGFVVTGSTTDGNVNAADVAPFDMPAPVSSYATFTCSALLDTQLTIPKEALTVILQGNPTRIETRVIRATFSPISDGLNKGNVLMGHTLVGHTTFNPK